MTRGRGDVMIDPAPDPVPACWSVLVLGGARSGKSEYAEALAADYATRLGESDTRTVVYVATGAAPGGGDPDWDARVDDHRRRRPAAWQTLEVPPGGDLAGLLAQVNGVALVDSLGTWVAGGDPSAAQVQALCDAIALRSGQALPTLVVSEEVGLGVHAPTESGRRFADALGAINQAVARVAERAVLVVAGRILELAVPGRAE
ncbi:MAG: bifunctional adenosylcobinamide kinase/adenosylcobinamide-phosphate guanylyltransferase [Acidimicrobiales bacterium]